MKVFSLGSKVLDSYRITLTHRRFCLPAALLNLAAPASIEGMESAVSLSDSSLTERCSAFRFTFKVIFITKKFSSIKKINQIFILEITFE